MRLILKITIFCAVFNCIAQKEMSPKEQFFEMNGRLVETSISLEENFAQSYSEFLEVAKKNPKKYKSMVNAVNELALLVNDLNDELEELKQEVLIGIVDPSDYTSMDKSSFTDSLFFKENKLSNKGTEFLNTIDDFRKAAIRIGEDYPKFTKMISARFSTEEVLRNDGEVKSWIEYNFKGFPLVAVLTKLTSFQAEAKYAEQQFLDEILAKSED